MKSASVALFDIAPELQCDAEKLLSEGETMNSFVEQALREQIAKRKSRREFVARGLAAGNRAKVTGKYVSKEEVMESLQSMIRS